MTEQDFDEFSMMIAATAEMYRQTVGEFAIGLWFQSLSDYPLNEISLALSMHIKNPDNGQFMPKPADIIKFLHGSNLDKAYAAWAKVEMALRSVGAYESVCFDDALIHLTIEQLGGWVKLCQTQERDLPFVARDFEKIYRGLCSRNTSTSHLPYLVGIMECENQQKGFVAAPIVVVGNQDQAYLIQENGKRRTLVQISQSVTKFKERYQNQSMSLPN